MFERFSREARAVVERAVTEASYLGADSVEAEHLLLALTEISGIARATLVAALKREQEQALAVVGVRAGDYDAPARRPGGLRGKFGTSAKLALERALKVVLQRGEKRILPEHLLLGVLAAEHGTVPRALRAGEIDAGALRRAAEQALDEVPSTTL
jgi:D-alanyl-D-alanine carboxypeptidase